MGLYLSDLTFLDSAYKNHLTIDSKVFIHFEKHRKIFEILAQIHLFKLTLDAFDTLTSDTDFNRWFESIRIYSDTERSVDYDEYFLYRSFLFSWKRSEKLEAPQVSSASLTVPYVNFLVENFFHQRKFLRFPFRIYPFNNHSNGPSSSRSQQTNLTTVGSHEDEQDKLNVMVFFPGKNEGKGKQIRVRHQLHRHFHFVSKYFSIQIGTNDRVPSVLKIILLEFDLDPSHYYLYSIEQKLSGHSEF